MTTVHDIADIVRIIREQPEWADTIRSILLSRELLELPQRFAEYAEASDRRFARIETALAEFVESTNRHLEALETGQAAMKADLVELKSDVKELKSDVSQLRIDMGAVRQDLRPLKASHARNGAERGTRRIARSMNCFQVRLLNSDDLHRLLAGIDSDDISRSDRDSFEDADIVIAGEHRETGETHYIAVEASFTAHEDDTRRAIRNADYLARSTGQPAHAVVASRVIDPSVESIFASGRVHWYEIPLRHLESD